MAKRGERRRLRIGFGMTAVVVGALLLAAPASAVCGQTIGDPTPGYWGSALGIDCDYDGGAPISWTVPEAISEVRFGVRGADDATKGRGGTVRGALPATPGETFSLEPGGHGEASVLSLNGTTLVVAGGGNASVSNYVTPAASGVESQPSGAPIAPAADGVTYVGEGEVSLSLSTITKAPGWCVVPRLRGMRPIVARKQLAKANCAVGEITRRPARHAQWGRVTRQWPRAGTELPPNGKTDFQVGRPR